MDAPTRDIRLIMPRADGTHLAIPLPEGPSVVGRDARTDIRIPLLSVAARHCRIDVEPDEVTLTALEGAEMRVNGRATDQAVLADRDEVHIGSARFTVSFGVPSVTVVRQATREATGGP